MCGLAGLIDNFAVALRIDRGHLNSTPEEIVAEPLGENDVHLFRSPGHHRNWLDCIHSRQRCVADVEIGARTVTIAHLGNLGYWYDRPLEWDPASWTFANPADNLLRDRPRRPGSGDQHRRPDRVRGSAGVRGPDTPGSGPPRQGARGIRKDDPRPGRQAGFDVWFYT